MSGPLDDRKPAAPARRGQALRQLVATCALPVAPDGARDPLSDAVAPFQAPATGRIPCACVVAEAVERVLRSVWPVGVGDSPRALMLLLCTQALAAAEEAACAADVEAAGAAERRLRAAPLLHAAGAVAGDALAPLLPPWLAAALGGTASGGGASSGGGNSPSAAERPAASKPLEGVAGSSAQLGTAPAAAEAPAGPPHPGPAAAASADGPNPLSGLTSDDATNQIMRALGARFEDQLLRILVGARLRDLGAAAAWACAQEALWQARQQQQQQGGRGASAASATAAGPDGPPLAARAFLQLTRPSRTDPALLLQLAAAAAPPPLPLRPYQEQVLGGGQSPATHYPLGAPVPFPGHSRNPQLILSRASPPRALPAL